METTDNASEPALVSDTLATTELAAYVAANRQHPPPLPKRVGLAIDAPEPESAAARTGRESREAERAERRLRADIAQRAKDLCYAAGERYRDCTLENFRCSNPRQKRVAEAVREYIADDRANNVILFGPVGTGKDHLAFAICRDAIRSGKTVGWVNGQKWFGTVRDAMDTAKSEESLIAELRRPAVLCLSDPLPPVGALTQYQTTMLYRLVDARYSRGLPTICTVNVADNAEADERLGAATWDRLCHDAWKLHCAWPSYRKPAKEV